MSDIKISRTQKALRLIQDEGVTAKEAAERVGITSAAVSKGKHHPSKTQQKIRMFSEMQEEIESLRQQLAISEAEGLEQARLLGMSGEREAELRAEIERLKRDQNQLARNEAQKMLDNGTGGYYESQIIALRQQLAEKDAEIERLRNTLLDSLSDVLDAKESMSLLGIHHNTFPEMIKAMCQQLAASQAYAQQLLDALEFLNARIVTMDLGGVVERALALPQDTTAIEAMITKAGEVMREQCAGLCDRFAAREMHTTECSGAIRAMPGVTLEDLK